VDALDALYRAAGDRPRTLGDDPIGVAIESQFLGNRAVHVLQLDEQFCAFR
jgi:hypothetical protein